MKPKAFTISRQDQDLIGLADGYTPYQWRSLSDNEQQVRIERIISNLGAEVIRKALLRVQSLRNRDQAFWIVTLSGFRPDIFQRFVKDPPGPLPSDFIEKAAYLVFVAEELRRQREETLGKLQEQAIAAQIALNDS